MGADYQIGAFALKMGCKQLKWYIYSLVFIWKPSAFTIEVIVANEIRKSTNKATNTTIEQNLIIFNNLLSKFKKDSKERIIESNNSTMLITEIGFPTLKVAPIIDA